jgi:hypothetical protein
MYDVLSAQPAFHPHQTLEDHTLDFYEALIDAAMSYGGQQKAHLQTADARLVKVRKYLRLARDLNWLTADQYQYAAAQVTEIGNLLGGWRNPKAKSAPQ